MPTLIAKCNMSVQMRCADNGYAGIATKSRVGWVSWRAAAHQRRREVEGRTQDGTGGCDESAVGILTDLRLPILLATPALFIPRPSPRACTSHRSLRAPDHRKKPPPPPQRGTDRSSPFLGRRRQSTAGEKAKMSWQTYVDEHLMCDIEGHTLASAAILGHDGTVWAQSADFPAFKPENMTNIMKDFDEPGSLAPTGMFIGETKYMVIQGEPGAVIRGKKGSGGITLKKTGQALVVGIYDEPMTPGQCNLVVERLGDYLVEQGM